MVRRRDALIAVTGLVLVLAGCGEVSSGVQSGRAAPDAGATRIPASPTTADPGTTLPATTSQPTTSAGGSDSTDVDGGAAGVVVEVLDAGAEPRHALRLAFVEGDVVRVEQTLEQAVVADVAGDSTTADQSINTVVERRVTSVDGRSAVVSATFEELTSNVAAQSILDLMKGVVVTMTIDDRGRIADLATDETSVPSVLEGLLDGQLESIRESAFILPEEPVGVGARWRWVSEIAAAGIPMRIEQVVTLVADAGDRIDFEIVATFTEGEGEVAIPGLGTLGEVNDLKISGHQNGTGQLVLRHGAPSTTSTSLTEIGYVLTIDDQPLRTATTVDQRLRITVEPA